MPIPFSAKGKLTPDEAIEFRKHEVRITFPMGVRLLLAVITGGLGVWYAWVSYIEELNMTLAYVGIVLCALVPFALVWLYRLLTLLRFRLLNPNLPESAVAIDSDGLEVSVSDVTVRWKWKHVRLIANTPTGLMFFVGYLFRPVLWLPNRVFGETDKQEILALALHRAVSVLQLA